MPSEPLIFVEVALTASIPSAIAPILSAERDRIEPDQATTAVFYSISNCQKGLRGISFGNFLIKQVVVELQRELPGLSTFVTLSPVPAMRRWAAKALDTGDELLSEKDREVLSSLSGEEAPTRAFAAHLAALYLTRARHPGGTAYDPVAHFHLGNGAVLHKVHAEADLSPRGLSNSYGVMVNYLYDGPQIEAHHQAYATAHEVAASAEIAASEGVSKHRVYKLVDLAFLAPDVVRDVFAGSQSTGLTTEWLLRHAIPALWDEQRDTFRTL